MEGVVRKDLKVKRDCLEVKDRRAKKGGRVKKVLLEILVFQESLVNKVLMEV
jgi:hypothetical protein